MKTKSKTNGHSNGKSNGKPNGKADPEVKQKQYRIECIQRFLQWIAGNGMPDNEDSLIEWDRLQNNKQLLDWDQEANFLRGLRMQASTIRAYYSRERLVDAEGGFVTSMPGVWKRGGNYVQVSQADTSQEFADYLLKHWLHTVRAGYIRMWQIGIKHPRIYRALLDEIKTARKLTKGMAKHSQSQQIPEPPSQIANSRSAIA